MSKIHRPTTPKNLGPTQTHVAQRIKQARAEGQASGKSSLDAMEAASNSGRSAATRAAVNGQTKSVMGRVKNAAIGTMIVAVLAGGAFAVNQGFFNNKAPDPTPVVVPVEQPGKEVPTLPTPVDPGKLPPAPIGSQSPGESPTTETPAPGLPSQGLTTQGLPTQGLPTQQERSTDQSTSEPSPERPVIRLEARDRDNGVATPIHKDRLTTFKPWERPSPDGSKN